MNMLKIEIEINGIVNNTKLMAYNGEKEFFTALVTLCDELGADVPLWTTQEEKTMEKYGNIKIDMHNGGVLSISSYITCTNDFNKE